MMIVIEQARVPVSTETDVVVARQQGRQMAAKLGFSITDQVAIATAISELARNIFEYAKIGEVMLQVVEQDGRNGLIVVAHDDGPGIADIERVLQGGYSTSGGLGLGVSGTKRLMDEFEIVSQPGKGTTVTVKKWRR